MRELETLVTPARPSPGTDGLATPLVGLIVIAAILVRVLRPRRRSDYWDDKE